MNKRYTTNEFLFFLAWVLFSSSLILMATIFYVNNDNLEAVLRLVRYFAYVICLIKILRTQYMRTRIAFIILLVILFVLSGVGTGNLTYPLYCLIVLASFGISGDKIISVTARLQLFFLVSIIGLSQLGIIKDYVFDPQIRARHGLGFSWVTTAPILFFYFVLCYVYTNRTNLSTGKLLALELVNMWLFYMTDSKMAFMMSTAFILFIAYENKNKHRWKWLSKFKKIYIAFPFLMLALTLFVVRVYDWYKPSWALIDRIMSYRLGLAQNAYQLYGIHLLGQPINWVGYDYKATLLGTSAAYNYVDNSYLQITFNNGALFLVGVLFIYSFAIYKSIKNNDYYLVMIYIAILVIALTEPRLMNFAYNPFPLLAMSEMSMSFANERVVKIKKRIMAKAA